MTAHHLSGAISRDQSHESFTKSTIRGCGGIFLFLEKSGNRVVEFDAAAVEVLHLSRDEARAKTEETGAELLVEGGLSQRRRCELCTPTPERPFCGTASYRRD